MSVAGGSIGEEIDGVGGEDGEMEGRVGFAEGLDQDNVGVYARSSRIFEVRGVDGINVCR